MMKKIAILAGVTGGIVLGGVSQAEAGYGAGEGIGYILIFLLVTLIIFLICREIFCWYWKINERLAVLKEIRDLLRKSQGASAPHLNEGPSPNSEITCLKCGKCYPENTAGTFCENCGTQFNEQRK